MRRILTATALGALVAMPAMAQDTTTINAVMPKQRSANYFPLIVGEALGYFEEEGIEVNLLPSDTPIPFVNFLRNGQADIAMLDSAEVLQAIAAGVDLNVIYEVMQTAPDGIAISGDSSITDVEELAGETVGLVSDRDRVTMQIALDARGMTEDDVTTVVVGEAGPTLAAAFRDQTVAAIAGSGPDWLAIQANGIPVKLITPEEVSNKPGNTFAVMASTLEEKGDAIEGYLRAWSKGMYVAEVDPEVVAQIARTAVPEEWEDPEFGQQYLNNAIRLNVSVTETLGGLNTETWSAIQPGMQKFGLIDEQVEPDRFLQPGPVEAANDFDRAEVEEEVAAWREANM
ncbi:ABC transporter substrate-binding protein [Palleronia pelagia]|uniref:NitT/TauT family transport system substrate-binding protein n=1 Tax=Palleronia pelagia TaxID=387096 RepID=A0A1H8AHE1_9RHOB|nr:ABC transporter substrate-binding protein [Palleronia pelagia]SEM69963.1 NitT/TauT family transport system substrate-binding protein [Palleronia pelagia]